MSATFADAATVLAVFAGMAMVLLALGYFIRGIDP